MLKPHYLILFVLFAGLANAQLKVIKPVKAHPKTTRLALGAGISRSVLYLNRNVKENNDALGFNTNLVYGGNKLLRVSLDYTFFRTINIAPTWYNVKAQTIEANLHFLARLPSKKAVFFPIFGVSYNIFSGYFTGINDNLNLKTVYRTNATAVSRWLGLNVGTGYEYYFRPGSFFVDYKMRVGRTEGTQQLNIMDVCFSAGLRYNLRVPSLYQIFKGTRSRYSVDKDSSDW